MQKRIRITDLLYPHWKTLTLALIAVMGTSITDVLEPWPLKIVFDHVFGSKRLPDWLASLVGFIGTDKFSILNFAVLSRDRDCDFRRDQFVLRKVSDHQRRPMGDARPATGALQPHSKTFAFIPRSQADWRSNQPGHHRH